ADEMVALEVSTPGTNDLAQQYLPIYDATGSMATVVSAANENPVEFYDYDPYGNRTIHVSSSSPHVNQVRVVGQEVWVELSKPVLPAALAAALGSGKLKLYDETAHQAVSGLVASQPGERGAHPRQRLVLSAAAGAVPPAGHQVTLAIPAEGMQDRFLRKADQAYTLTFTWPAADAVVAEHAARKVEHVALREGVLEITFSAEPDLASAAGAIQVDGAPLGWTVSADRYTLRSTTPLAPGQHSLTV